MKKENYLISEDGLNRLEYAVTYTLSNALSLVYLCCDMCGEKCNLEGNEIERINAVRFVKESEKLDALVNTVGDMLEDSSVLLQAVIGEIYENKKGNE